MKYRHFSRKMASFLPEKWMARQKYRHFHDADKMIFLTAFLTFIKFICRWIFLGHNKVSAFLYLYFYFRLLQNAFHDADKIIFPIIALVFPLQGYLFIQRHECCLVLTITAFYNENIFRISCTVTHFYTRIMLANSAILGNSEVL